MSELRINNAERACGEGWNSIPALGRATAFRSLNLIQVYRQAQNSTVSTTKRGAVCGIEFRTL
jgi:hypothetical protein